MTLTGFFRCAISCLSACMFPKLCTQDAICSLEPGIIYTVLDSALSQSKSSTFKSGVEKSSSFLKKSASLKVAIWLPGVCYVVRKRRNHCTSL